MDILYLLIPLSVVLVFFILGALWWAIYRGQFDDVDREGEVRTIRLVPPGSRAANPAFDVTPARLVSGLITERGVCAASEAGLLSLFPERRQTAA